MGSVFHGNSQAFACCVSKDQNLERASRALDNKTLVRLYLGSFPDCQVDLGLEIVERLESLKLLDESTSATIKSELGRKSHSCDLGVMQSLLSFQNDNQDQQ